MDKNKSYSGIKTMKKSFDQKPKKCVPTCSFFKCSQRALEFRYHKGRKIAWCKYVPGGEYCDGPNCTYGFCVKHKIKPDNTCGLYSQQRNKRSVEKDYDFEDEKWKKDVRMKDKVMKRFKDMI
ncbi:MAG: hypothetical protein ACTSQY_03420 [Candidatus Odinarchaeia archaeon]